MVGQSYKLLLVHLVAGLICTKTAAEPQIQRLFGGEIIHVDQAKYTVQLRDQQGTFMCGGALVSPQHVITAAHCFDFNPPNTVTIVGGANTIRDQGVQRSIVKSFIPDAYTRPTLKSDVAIVKLNSPMVGNNIQTIRLCSKAMKPGDMVKFNGWGRQTVQGPVSERLRTLSAPVVSQANCKRDYEELHSHYPDIQIKVTDTMFCAYAKNKNICQHDSGGPVVHNGELCGVISWSAPCERAEYPQVSTSIHAMRSYIDNALRS